MSLIAERVLNLAVTEVRANCALAMRMEHDEQGLHPLTLMHAINLETLTAAVIAADLILAAEPKEAYADRDRHQPATQRGGEVGAAVAARTNRGIPRQRRSDQA